MIPVKNINGSPESVPEKYFGKHSDTENFYFFESEEDHKKYLLELPAVEDEVTEKINPAIEILEGSTEEEIIKINQLLKTKNQ